MPSLRRVLANAHVADGSVPAVGHFDVVCLFVHRQTKRHIAEMHESLASRTPRLLMPIVKLLPLVYRELRTTHVLLTRQRDSVAALFKREEESVRRIECGRQRGFRREDVN